MARIFLVIAVFGMISCAVRQHTARIAKPDVKTDSTAYELIVLEPGYDSWVATNRKPIWYYSYSYYRNHNMLDVNEWNYRVRTKGYAQPYEYLIDYDRNIDYGIDLEFELFWYFRYMEHKYDMQLSATGRS